MPGGSKRDECRLSRYPFTLGCNLCAEMPSTRCERFVECRREREKAEIWILVRRSAKTSSAAAP
jgi:hypothetical protein